MKSSSKTIQIPIEIKIKIGDISIGTQTARLAEPLGDQDERFWLDEEYDTRPGYDPEFLGEDVVIELPTLSEDMMKLASRDLTTDRSDSHVLRYHHFSLVMNARRRMLFYAAYNTTRDEDLIGTWSRKELSGGSDKWILDPRIPPAHQVRTRELYGPLEFDRGHVVKRDDVYWGADESAAQYANFDSFHYTNCTPQHPNFNRSNKQGIWGKLEKYIAKQVEAEELRLNVFAGPVLRRNDPWMNGVKIPRRYWKIIVARRESTGELSAWAFLLSQSKQVTAELRAMEAEEAEEETIGEFSPGEFETYTVPIAKIESITGLSFPENVQLADTKGQEESMEITRIDSLSDIEV